MGAVSSTATPKKGHWTNSYSSRDHDGSTTTRYSHNITTRIAERITKRIAETITKRITTSIAKTVAEGTGKPNCTAANGREALRAGWERCAPRAPEITGVQVWQ